MKTLQAEFTKSGWTYKQLARKGDVALYEKSKDVSGNKIVAYEIIIVRHAVADWYTVQKGDESYPSSEQWGTYAWTPKNEEDARKYFDFLVDLQDSKDGLSHITTKLREWRHEQQTN